MNLQVTARRFKLSEGIEKMVQKEVNHFARFFDGIQDVHVVLTTDHGLRHVDVTVHVPRDVFNVEAEGSDQFSVILPQALKKMETRLHKFKEKLKQ